MSMLRKYWFFLFLGPVSNALWGYWALPQIGEQGTQAETFQWLCTQAILPAVFAVSLAFGMRFVLWFVLIYSGFMLLFGIGIFGWALMGPGTPLSIYAVCVLIFIMGFGLLYQSLKDLNFGRKEPRYDAEDERE
ncbi:MAG: hypothetical protein ACREH5_05740 [Candidatus Omnitrophota bacterium]